MLNTSNYLSTAKNSASRIANRAIDTGINYGINYIKNTLGKEYVFAQEDDKEVISAIINDFIAKVYSNIEAVGFKNKYDKYELKNVEFIITLGKKRKDTWIYVATGNKMGSFEERFMSSRNISEQDMKLFVFGRRANLVVDKLQTIIDKASMISNELGIYDINSGMDMDEKGQRRGSGLHIVYNQMQPRTMETMYFSSG
jgi:hypothetical protein